MPLRGTHALARSSGSSTSHPRTSTKERGPWTNPHWQRGTSHGTPWVSRRDVSMRLHGTFESDGHNKQTRKAPAHTCHPNRSARSGAIHTIQRLSRGASVNPAPSTRAALVTGAPQALTALRKVTSKASWLRGSAANRMPRLPLSVSQEPTH